VAPPPEKLELTLARIASVVNSTGKQAGTERVGSPELLDTHRSEGFRMKHFVAPAPKYNQQAEPAQQAPLTALRIFRPPLPVAVAVRDGRPARLTCEGCSTLTGNVIWTAGPWRSSGEWWEPVTPEPPITDVRDPAVKSGISGWARNEWDLAIERDNGIVLCRVYCAGGQWYAEGTYD
jgi:protein ImuB